MKSLANFVREVFKEFIDFPVEVGWENWKVLGRKLIWKIELFIRKSFESLARFFFFQTVKKSSIKSSSKKLKKDDLFRLRNQNKILLLTQTKLKFDLPK